MKNDLQRSKIEGSLNSIFSVHSLMCLKCMCLFIILGLNVPLNSNSQTLKIRGLSCENISEPMGIETPQPRFSWKLDYGKNGQSQVAYQLLVADSKGELIKNNGNLWHSPWNNDPNNQLISYAGTPLKSLKNYWWKVRVRDSAGSISPWSEATHFATGLLEEKVAPGQWLFNPSADPKTGTSWFRKSFQINAIPPNALLLLASRAYHELYVNGKKVGNRALAPNSSILEKRTFYVVYDILPYLKSGKNTVAVWISPGRVGGAMVVPSFLAYAKIGPVLITSDTTWKVKTANLVRYYPVMPKPLFGGEQWNATTYIKNWNATEYVDLEWGPAALRKEVSILSADIIPPTRRIETINAKSVQPLPDGSVVVDFGVYFTGQLEALVQGAAGKPIRFTTLGDLSKPVDFGQVSELIPEKSEKAVFQHHFHWNCGRFVIIQGLTKTPKPEDIKVHRISIDFERTGFFHSSNALLNQIYQTDINTYRNVTLDGYNQDCTHRERRGYGEHAFGTSRGMAGNFNLTAFVRNWLRDWRDVQRNNGFVPHTAPEGAGGGGTLWSSFNILGAWDFYIQSGDSQFLKENYEAARRWATFLHIAVKDTILSRYETGKWDFLGDWARPVPPEQKASATMIADWGDKDPAYFFNNCIYALDLQTMEKVSERLGKMDDAAIWNNRLKALRPAIHNRFFVPGQGVYVEPNQVRSMLADLARIVPKEDMNKMLTALDAELRSTDYIDAGSSGLPFFLEFISQHREYHQWLFDLLQRREYPGYGYFLDQGYNTWPELWNPELAASKVHSCFIGISSFFIRALAGIEPSANMPGYGSFSVNPSFVKGLDNVSYRFDSPRGWIKLGWVRKGNQINMNLEVPPGSEAEVHLPSGIQLAQSGAHHYSFKI